jgi:hypothetical protein
MNGKLHKMSMMSNLDRKINSIMSHDAILYYVVGLKINQINFSVTVRISSTSIIYHY